MGVFSAETPNQPGRQTAKEIQAKYAAARAVDEGKQIAAKAAGRGRRSI